MTQFQFIVLLGCLVGISLFGNRSLSGQDGALTDEPDASRYEIPANATPDQLIRLIRAIVEFDPQTFAEYRMHVERAPAAIEIASQAVLDSNPDPESVTYRDAKLAIVRAHTMQVPFRDEAFHRTVVDELTAMVNEFQASNETYSLSKLAIRAIRQAGSVEVAIDGSRTLGAMFEESAEPRLILNGQRMVGAARRLGILGESLELEGTTLSGEPLDWDAFRGGWTIVYFWSTSIGPAEKEFAQLLDIEEKFRANGLKMLAISLDVKRQVVEEFLSKRGIKWVCLFEEFSGWDHPMAIRYGVDELPLAILVDESGQVISVAETPSQLDRRLSDHFGRGNN